MEQQVTMCRWAALVKPLSNLPPYHLVNLNLCLEQFAGRSTLPLPAFD